jgi:phage shock protein C
MNRRLYRSRRESVLGGVAGGVAEYLDVDPSIVRIIWVVLAIVTGGLFLVLYIVMWIVVPESPPGAPAVAAGAAAEPAARPSSASSDTAPASDPYWEGTEERLRRAGSGGAVILGLILIAVGVWFLIDEYLPAFDRDLIWPIALVAIGAALLVVSLRRRAQ